MPGLSAWRNFCGNKCHLSPFALNPGGASTHGAAKKPWGATSGGAAPVPMRGPPEQDLTL